MKVGQRLFAGKYGRKIGPLFMNQDSSGKNKWGTHFDPPNYAYLYVGQLSWISSTISMGKKCSGGLCRSDAI
ncbi:hypothetical protein [Pseudovibrio sp. Tun.PSC04-5.I4]|uniref:hypothetical protein n=1 Tax=Pseudovibrio sp. Tun.PSC04-5.I4 TaxID=1798213 RepID=UPI00089245FF|nr:hypothetical protein [Pseudovibrio sp. Tun.PSC04-5.I4]SDR09889.1 hypothetical protein SAMN04515695_2754 [Pseudovibrio sp. Tun.PSC04-5.I4]